MDDGTRTHDDRDHNPGLYQLSYAHHCYLYSYRRGIMARPAGLEPATLGLAYHHCFHSPYSGLWPGPSLHPLRCRTYGLYGSPDRRRRRCFVALPPLTRAFEHRGSRPPNLRAVLRDPGFPRDCHQHDLLRVPRYSAVHSDDSVSRQRLLPSSKADALSG